MGKYIIRRLLQAVFTLLMISIVTFTVAKATPGGPFGFDDPEVAARISATMKQHYRELYGLDKPVVVQYFNWLVNALKGDFGTSFQYRNESVQSIIARTWGASAQLGLISAAIALGLGTLVGIAAALKRGGFIDSLATAFTVLCYSMPSFVLGVLLLVVFCVQLRWFPVTGWGTPNRMVLPVFALTLSPLAQIIRFTRSSMLEQMNQDYVRTAHAKGLRPRAVMMRHVLKNALIPVVTIAGPMIAFLVTGSVFVETMFSVPGMARAFVSAAGTRDYPMIMASAVLYGTLIILMNLLVDIAYGWIDPRIRYD
jgi:oligopeptide transport system permease protein